MDDDLVPFWVKCLYPKYALMWLEIENKLDRKELEESFNERFWTFNDHNPLTGMPAMFIFNESIEGKKNVISWNKLTECWFYSEDAGLTWEKVEFDRLTEYIYRADVMYPSNMRK